MKFITASILMFVTSMAYADEGLMVNTKNLSLSTATTIAQAAVVACTKKGIQIGVTVVDRQGVVQVTLRDSIAAQITVPISKGKAYTAVNFNAATSALGERANGPIGRVPGIIMSAGGLPIQVGGSLVGGVGVSGAPSGETDEACAQAGIDAVMDDLEMSM
ncbi:MAG: heme-binding protein [Gammaproteobacteria bacterium]|nr:heme-binding protein [Gammaproteobacteria bacterium]